jgi:hypothetical protein
MTTIPAVGPELATEPVSLYIDLVPGAKADLEVIARAALAFSGAVREFAYIIDPSLEVRIELVSGTESSLSLNSWFKSKLARQLDSLSLAALSTGILMWLGIHAAEFAYDEVLRAITGHGEMAEISPEQIDALAKKVVQAIEAQNGTQHATALFRELESDPAINGVGATREPGARPANIIPRTEFHNRTVQASGHGTLESDGRRDPRTVITIETLTLVSPVLLKGNRRWKFLGRDGEFGAVIKDPTFLDSVLRGLSAIPMAGGIRMEVELQTISDPIEQGAWQVRVRNILRVRKVTPPAVQLEFGSSPQTPSEPPDSDDEDNQGR